MLTKASPAGATLVRGDGEEIVLEPPSGWRMVDWRELWRYRDLFYFMVWRDLKARYAQSILGIGWAVIQPVFSMLVFTVIFGNLAEISSDGAPYALFSFAALVPWTYFSSTLSAASGSLPGAAGLLTKLYFPRLILPLTPVLSKLVDFMVSFSLLLVMLLIYRVPWSPKLLLLPLPVLLMMLTAAGLGMWLTALAVQYRDIRYAMGFVVQLLMYAAPVVYPTSLIPEKYQLLYAVNPMVGVIETFRAAVLGTRAIPWDFLAVGSMAAWIVALAGTFYFRRMESRFADVV